MAPSSRSRGRKSSGAGAHRNGTAVPGARTHHGAMRHRQRIGWSRATLAPMPLTLRAGTLVLGALLVVAGCGSGVAASFDPTGPCTTDGKAAGAYPDLEAMVPARFRGAPPDTLDSGRNCTVTNLGSLSQLGITEVRYAGGTWTFGAERAVVLAVFRTHGLSS